MGIFADKCEKCGNRVPKQARFCNKCGTGAPGGWTRCHNCNSWVGVEAEFCHSCRAALYPEERDLVVNGSIRRVAGVFLQRVDLPAIKRRLDGKLIIEEGTKAIVMENGKITDVLKPGAYNVDGNLLKRVFSEPAYKSFFLVDAGDVALPFNVLGLRSKEDMKLNFYTEAIFRFNPEKALALIENVLKDKRQIVHTESDQEKNAESNEVRYDNLWKCLEHEVTEAVRSMCLEASIDDLVKSAHVREAFENRLALTMSRAAERYGMVLVRCAAVTFFGKTYEELCEKAGNIEADARKAVLEKRARRIVSDDKLDTVKTEKDLQAQLDQLAYEYDLNKEQLDVEFKKILADLNHELEQKKQKQAQELKRDADDFRRENENIELDHNMGKEAKLNDFDRAEKDKDFAQMRSQDMATHEDKIKKAEMGLDLRAQRSALDAEEEKTKIANRTGQSVEALASVLSPEEFKQYQEAIKTGNDMKLKEMMANMAPEQMLAIQAGDNAELAKSVADIAKANAEANASKIKADMVNEKVELMEKNADRLEQVLDKSLDANARSAAAGSGNKNTSTNQS